MYVFLHFLIFKYVLFHYVIKEVNDDGSVHLRNTGGLIDWKLSNLCGGMQKLIYNAIKLRV